MESRVGQLEIPILKIQGLEFGLEGSVGAYIASAQLASMAIPTLRQTARGETHPALSMILGVKSLYLWSGSGLYWGPAGVCQSLAEVLRNSAHLRWSLANSANPLPDISDSFFVVGTPPGVHQGP